ncbi:phosphatase PAP2 family protein [Zymobacter palmae]|uniref:Membrane-associated phospholipid phosphatase n=1 Tax=Zymobacter palmae TaxID=33074 RepID=A0A348HG31_9GAMM|nr:phosphatase PAP2 family protein [Zymobacter palmae]BBG30583.1 membrane-associated phospholipid phosphatase [Zymobacter palmae]
MTTIRKILLLNVIGLLILFSWWQTAVPIWPWLDSQIFWGFNHTLTTEPSPWVNLLGVLNCRYFDMATFCALGLVLWIQVLNESHPQRYRRWAVITFIMMISMLIIALLTHLQPYHHASPTIEYAKQGLNPLSVEQIVHFDTKSESSSSFPGDHGLVMMIFAAFMLRFGTRGFGLASVILVILLSFPRIMVGAHWFEDVYMGSLSIALIILPWLLMTCPIVKVGDMLMRVLFAGKIDHH